MLKNLNLVCRFSIARVVLCSVLLPRLYESQTWNSSYWTNWIELKRESHTCWALGQISSLFHSSLYVLHFDIPYALFSVIHIGIPTFLFTAFGPFISCVLFLSFWTPLWVRQEDIISAKHRWPTDCRQTLPRWLYCKAPKCLVDCCTLVSDITSRLCRRPDCLKLSTEQYSPPGAQQLSSCNYWLRTSSINCYSAPLAL